MEDILVTGHKARAFSGKRRKKRGYDKDWPMLIVDVIEPARLVTTTNHGLKLFWRQHTKTLVCILTRLHSTLVGA